MSQEITSPDDAGWDELCQILASRADQLDQHGSWPAEQLEALASFGVYRWFLPVEWGGFDWSQRDIVLGHVRLAGACLTTTFILTQRTGACRRIVASSNERLKARLLPSLADGVMFATIGISHLTTSRQHLSEPALRAEPVSGGYLLEGYSPWVTGASRADWLVVGADSTDGQGQLLAAVSTTDDGVSCDEPAHLVGLTASHTGAVRFDRVFVPEDCLIDPPQRDLLVGGARAGTGGIQTSALAVGHASASIAYLRAQSESRSELAPVAATLEAEFIELRDALCRFADGDHSQTSDQLRTRANNLALRSSQAALTAAKGAGYIQGHPAGRWCREALFFLVWSCPRPVTDRHLCELAAGLS